MKKILFSIAAGVAKTYNQIEVEMFGVNFSTTIHEAVFGQIKMSAPLMSMYQELASKLQYPNKAPFFPHLSLIYGNLSPDEKSRIASQFQLNRTLLLDRLVIYRDGPLSSDWSKVAEFKLN